MEEDSFAKVLMELFVLELEVGTCPLHNILQYIPLMMMITLD